MKALIALLMFLLVIPASAEEAFSANGLSQVKTQMDNLARQLLLTSSEAEIEFTYEQRSSACQCNISLQQKLRQKRLEYIYRYRIVYKKTADGGLHYQVESETTLNGKFRSRTTRA